MIDREELEAERFADVPENATAEPSELEFQHAALSIVAQRNDFLLPNLIDMLETHKTLEVSPYYQRRERWNSVGKSKLIESFLVNIPVPPVFLCEDQFAQYEVMDGQQWITAILEYFRNGFPLHGLEILTSLQGKRFRQLPATVRAGLERRLLSAIILLKESTPTDESAIQLRRYVFERLNTGGVRLNAQEVRNSVNAGPFNDLLIDLSRDPTFTRMWDIPPREPNETVDPSGKLRRNTRYRLMRDVELVLRVCALLDAQNIGKGMRKTLDETMTRYSRASHGELHRLGAKFIKAIDLADLIGGDNVFRLPAPSRTRRGRPSASLYDGIMVALIRNLKHAGQIEARAAQINRSIRRELGKRAFHELVVGRANTREAGLKRAEYIERLIASVLSDTKSRSRPMSSALTQFLSQVAAIERTVEIRQSLIDFGRVRPGHLNPTGIRLRQSVRKVGVSGLQPSLDGAVLLVAAAFEQFVLM